MYKPKLYNVYRLKRAKLIYVPLYVTKGQTFRESFKVHLPASGIHDKLTSIDVQVSIMQYVLLQYTKRILNKIENTFYD